MIGSDVFDREGRQGMPEPVPALHSRAALLWLNAVGGVAVLASYAVGLGSESVAAGLWGGVPESLRPLYTVNMFLAAGGYFLFTYYIVFRLCRAGVDAPGSLPSWVYAAAYAAILVPSALWLPLTALMLSAPSGLLWFAIRLVLALVGFGSLTLLVSLLTLRAPVPRGRALAVIGLLPFILQTAVLDALIWPAYFPH